MIHYTFYSFFIWKLLIFLHIFLKECEKCSYQKQNFRTRRSTEGASDPNFVLSMGKTEILWVQFGSRILFAEKHGELMAPDPFSLLSPQVWGRHVQQSIGRWTNVTWHSGSGMVGVEAGESWQELGLRPNICGASLRVPSETIKP